MKWQRWQVAVSMVLMYGILLLCHGYQFGSGDMVQLDPLVLYHTHPDLYQGDLYIANATASFPNERFFFLQFLYPFSDHLEWISFLLHIGFSILLLAGIRAISKRYIFDEWLRLLVPLVVFIPLYGINLGSNELYYGIFHPSLVAKAIGVWAIFSWLNSRVILALLISALSTLMHPVAGLQVFTGIFLAESALSFQEKRSGLPKRLVIGGLLWLFTAGIFIILLFFRFRDTSTTGIDFFQIFYVFRNPHHYLPTSFPVSSWYIIGGLTMLGTWLYYYKERRLFWFFIVHIVLLGIYSYSTLQLRFESITTLQWFKATIWLEMLSVVAVIGWLEKWWSKLAPVAVYRAGVVALLIAVLAYGWLVTPSYAYAREYQPYQLPFRDYTDDAIVISKAAKAATPKDALFIHPCHFTELKYFGERSSFVEYKALTHTKSFLKEWSERLALIYRLDYTSSPAGYQTCRYADEQFRKWTADDLLEFNSRYGITHIITYADTPLDLPVVAANDTYVLYDCRR
jgi:hypothetical protein